MEERHITVTLNKAKEWFNSGNATLKEIALQAFNEEELKPNFKDIISFRHACNALGINYDVIYIVTKDIAIYSRASAAMFKLNIVRKALNLGYDLSLTKNSENPHLYYPCNPFVTENSTRWKNALNSGKIEVIGTIKSNGTLYNVLGGSYGSDCGKDGLGGFCSTENTGYAFADVGFLGCANQEIAQHFSKYFGMLITEAKYADMVDIEIHIH